MKILEVLDSFYPDVDGPIDVVVNLAKKFKQNNLGEMEILVPSYPEKVEVEGVTVHRCFSVGVNEYRGSVPALDKKVKKLIKKGGFDLIHIHSPFTLGKYALKLAKRYNIPVLYTMHTKFRDEFERRLKSKLLVKFMMRYIMKCINGCGNLTSVSRGTIKTLEEYGYKNCENVKVIRNATAMQPMAADKEATRKIREDLGLENVFTFLYVGRLAATKNIQFSLQTLAEVKKRGFNNFKFVLVGDGDYGKTLKKLAKELDLSDNVIFAGKITDKNLLACYYSACDALLFPSVFDNASLVLLEAAVNGLPIVTVKDSCSAEYIEDGIRGFVWENDINAWAENLTGILSDPETLKNAGDWALPVYASWDNVAGQYAELYKELIDARKK